MSMPRAQVINCRPGDVASFNAKYKNSSLHGDLRFHLASLKDHSMLLHDELDHQIYSHAVARFHRELWKHNISSHTCPVASGLVRGTSCNADGQRLKISVLQALSFSHLFPNVTRQYVTHGDRAQRSRAKM